MKYAYACLALVLLAACGAKESAPAVGGSPGGAPPPPEVGVVTVSLQPVALQTELPGRVEPVRVAQVRSRVNGVVLKRNFQEGSLVRAGQLLFQIDPAPYRAATDSARASLARAQAGQTLAAAQAQRYRVLAEANAISQQEYQVAQAANQTAAADVAAARAAVQTANISLGYADVTAPIAGRIGRALVTEGALVSAAEATPLAVIQQTSTVYVNFTQSSAEVLRLRQALAANRVEKAGDGSTAVRVVLEDGTELPRPGRLLFTDLSVDTTSGQVTLRAEVPNPDGLLLPGQYVRVRLAQAQIPSAVLLPQQAVKRGEQGDTVLVVGADGKPTPRPVKIGSSQNNQWIVLDGLKPGEQVIVDGFQKMMVPGAPVKPVPWRGAASAASAPSSGGMPAPAVTPAAPAATAAASR